MRGSGVAAGRQLASHVVEADLGDDSRRDLDVAVRLDALQHAVGADVLDELEIGLRVIVSVSLVADLASGEAGLEFLLAGLELAPRSAAARR